MAGGCCCSVKRKDSAIIGFGVMNIAIFAVLLLICCKELNEECRSQQALREFLESYREDFDRNNRHDAQQAYFPVLSFDGCHGTGLGDSLVGCICFCPIGIIIGILLLVAVIKKSKRLFWIWIICQSLIVLALTITGFYILHLHNLKIGYLTYGNIPYPALFLLSPFPFFVWSLIAVFMSMNDIVSGTVGDKQDQIYGPSDNQPSFQPPSNQQMLPQNFGVGNPSQPQQGNNPV